MTQIISTVQTTQINATTPDDYLVTATGVVSTSSTVAAYFDTGATGSSLTVAGALESEETVVRNAVDDFGLTLAQSGMIVSHGTQSVGIDSTGNAAHVDVAGTIAVDDFAVAMSGAFQELHISSSGSLMARVTSPFSFGANATVLMYSAEQGANTSRLHNAGTITAGGIAPGPNTVAVANAALDIEGGDGFDAADTSVMRFENSGKVIGSVLLQDGDDQLVNSGLINGAQVNMGAGADLIFNTGTIFGVVEMGDGTDTFVGSGGFAPNGVNFGAGDDVAFGGINADSFDGGEDNDFLIGRGGDDSLYGEAGDDTLLAGGGDDFVLGGAGDDTLRGNGGDDILDGGTDNDLIVGGGGEDNISGGDGNDQILGNGGDDTIDGGARLDTIHGGGGDDFIDAGGWNDTVRGGGGEDSIDGNTGADDLHGGGDADILLGGAGNFADTLRGGAGDDSLDGGAGGDDLRGGRGDDAFKGGAGADTMNGGSGADTFIYESRSEAGTGTGTRDVITDFSRGQDIIDLEPLAGVATMTFIADGAFSGVQQEVRFDSVAEGVDVFIDTNGDGTADMRILMEGLAVVTADDFIL